MVQENSTLAILFADIAKSTQLYEKLGDTKAKEIIGIALGRLTEVTHRYDGTVIKTIGDEIMCTFPSALKAVEAAQDMQRAVETVKVSDLPGLTKLNLYVGFHYGPVIREGGDVFGDAVNLAARMVALAKPRQILSTEETVSRLPVEQRASVHYSDTTQVKGKTGEINVYEVVWEKLDVTVMVDRSKLAEQFHLRLELKARTKTLVVDSKLPSISLGRQPHNDIVVNDSRVSRTHAKVESRRGVFVLIDQSTNGTYVRPNGAPAARVGMDEYKLTGEGVIVLGRENAFDSPDAIQYSIKV